jgi:hypothetical protein
MAAIGRPQVVAVAVAETHAIPSPEPVHPSSRFMFDKGHYQI